MGYVCPNCGRVHDSTACPPPIDNYHLEQAPSYDPVFMPPQIPIRDWLAGMALSGLSTPGAGSIDPASWHWDIIADTAYKAADAMLKEKEKKQ